MKILRVLGISIGLAIVLYLIQQVGLAEIRHTLGLLKWGYGIVLIYPIVWILLNSAGWKKAFHPEYDRLSLIRLTMVRLAGETFNSLLPSGYVGGEPIKAKLLSRFMPLREATSSVLIAKSAQSIALVVFIALGLALGQTHASAVAYQRGTWVALGLLATGVTLFAILLARRSFSRAGQMVYRLTRWNWIQRQQERLAALDASIGNFYGECKDRFFMSVVFHLLGWVAGSMEVAVIFALIDHSISWRQAWFIGAMAQLASVIGMLVPAGVGLYEGGHYMAASMLGLNPALGLSVSLIRRVREVSWDTLGLFFFWKLSGAKPAPAPASGSREKGQGSL